MIRSTLPLVVLLGSLSLTTAACGGVVEERVVVREPGAVVIADAPPPPREEIIIARPSPRHHWEHGRWVRHGREWFWIEGRWHV
jgi:hypothetical protein